MDDQDLNQLLLRRVNPPMAHDGLVRRIIEQTAKRPQDGLLNLWALFIIPKPQWAMALVLVLGVVIGMASGDWSALMEPETPDLVYTFMIDETFSAGDFL